MPIKKFKDFLNETNHYLKEDEDFEEDDESDLSSTVSYYLDDLDLDDYDEDDIEDIVSHFFEEYPDFDFDSQYDEVEKLVRNQFE